LPNAGKSTLLAALSNAHPEINNYPFTTLTPNLGVVAMPGNTSLLFADIPGLIEGAAEGKGLGDDFLRHIERTLVILHLIDATLIDVREAYKTIQAELKAYKTDLTARPQIIVLNKTEDMSKTAVSQLKTLIRSVSPPKSPIIAISAEARQGLAPLLRRITVLVNREKTRQAHQPADETAQLPVWRLPDDTNTWKVERLADGFTVSGNKIERFAARTDPDNPASLYRLRDIMKKMGILHELIRQGIKAGQPIVVGERTIRY
jgi:GTP-binding protein